MSKGRVIALVAALLFVLFSLGVIQLFGMGMDEGGNFPPYSTFRSDPLGMRVFYGALKSMPGVNVRRNLEPFESGDLSRLSGDDKNATLVISGATVSPDPEDVIKELENFAAGGGRVVITFFPTTGGDSESFLRYVREGMEEEKEENKEEEQKKNETQSEEPNSAPENKKEPVRETEKKGEKDSQHKDENGDDQTEPFEIKWVSIEERWGFKYKYTSLESDEGDSHGAEASFHNGPEGLPAHLPWHSTLHFDKLEEPWATLYSIDDRAVVVERRWGAGSIVLAGDSYFLSNEGLMENRRAGLLAWIVGPNKAVIFDETHFGVQTRHNIMSLIRKYRLDGLLIALLALAAMFIWKNVASLAPKLDESAATDADFQGKDSMAGLINLLRRSIPTRQIISLCLDEWRKAFSKDMKFKGERERLVKQIINREASLPLGRGDPVKAYRDVCDILAQNQLNRSKNGRAN